VIEAPFAASADAARRLEELAASVGPAVQAAIGEVARRAPSAPLAGSTVPWDIAERIAAQHGLASTRELALLALPVAGAMARPPISGYRVAAIGIEAETGDLVLGANLEFPGTDLATTIHAEGFVALRARRRAATLATLAIREAHPCAHCRQTLAESATAERLAIVDLLGHQLSLEQLYPWPFRPLALGHPGDVAGAIVWPELALVEGAVPAEMEAALLEAGTRAHAPYSQSPSAVALRLRSGRIASAGVVECVAFNPTITAAQAALVEVAALRAQGEEIAEAWLARTTPGVIDPEPAFRSLLGAVAPDARLAVVDWRLAA
jgi:cytidine deaminase